MADLTNVDDDAVFAANVLAMRNDLGYTQSALAEAITKSGFSFHQSTVNKIERGERRVSIGEAKVIATILRSDISTMLTMKPGSETFLLWRIRSLRRHSGQFFANFRRNAELIVEQQSALHQVIAEIRAEYDASSAGLELLDHLERYAQWPLPAEVVNEITALEADTDRLFQQASDQERQRD